MMSSELEAARAQVAHLEKQAELAEAMAEAGRVYEADPTPENYAAHVRASAELSAHRAAARTGGFRIATEDNGSAGDED